jgi:uncharacterized surface protein with fasciclin (FAS1) repeats
MRLTSLFATAAAAALIACPALVAAQPVATPPVATPPVATPPAETPPASPPAPAAPPLPTIPKVAPGPNIYATLKDSGQFTLLIKALDETGLAPYLQSYPNFTFFAPTDAAFNALPPDVLAKLMAANDTAANQLQQILKYHLITVPVDSTKIRGAKGPVPTVENSPVIIDGSNPDDLKVNDADIIQADVRTANGGVINVIDKVLIPSDSPYAPPAPTPAAAAAPAPAPATPASAS